MAMLARLFLGLLLAPAVVTAQDIVVAVHGSTGINPSTSFSYIDRYGPDLQFRTTVLRYPLLTGSPRATVVVQGITFVSESRCTGYPDSVCRPHVVRHDPDGSEREVGPSLAEVPRALRFTSRGDLVAATSTEIVRIHPFTGETLDHLAYSLPPGGFLQDADVDPLGCGVAVSYYPGRLALGNLCLSSLALSEPLPGPAVHGVRFLPDGTLLTAGPDGVRRIDRTGEVLRLYPEPRGNCLLAIWPGGHVAIVACERTLSRLNLDSGTVIREAQIQTGISFESIDVIQNVQARRRAAEH